MVRLSGWLSALVAAVLLLSGGAALAQARPPSGPGQTCGGIAGLQCQQSLVCVMSGPNFPDRAGVCRSPGGGGVMCPAIFQPVCGVDGKTYSNRCVADRAGAAVAHTGQCTSPPPPQTPPPPICPQIFQPVCGVNGMTYPNRCIARANGVRVRHPGQCRRPGYGGPRGWEPPPIYGLPRAPVPYGSYPPPPPQPYGERG